MAQIQDAIESDQYLKNSEILSLAGIGENFCIEDTIIKGIDYRTEADGGRPLYIGVISYIVCYNRNVGTPLEGLENLENLTSELIPEDANLATEGVDSVTNF